MKINPLLALCALPALIQPAMASEKLDACEALIAEAMQTAYSYAEVIDMITDEKTTPAEGAKLIKDLTANLKNIHESLKKHTETLSPDEQEALHKMLADPELTNSGLKIRQAFDDLKVLLTKNKYFDSKELQAACEEYVDTYF